MTFEKRRLGQTDIEVSPIGLGVMQFAGGGGLFGKIFPVLAQEDKDAMVQTALDSGINWFDTAEMYGFGRSEQGLSAGLKAAGKENGDAVVATKWLPVFRSARNISKTIHDRFRYLDGYSIDLYMVHQPWSFSSIESQMDAMADLVEAGHIRSVGISNFNADQMRRAFAALEKRNLPLAVNQMEYSLVNRKIESNAVIATAKELGITITAYTPLGYGLLTGKYHKNPDLLEYAASFRRKMLKRNLEATRPIVDALEEIGKKYDATPGQVALNWVIHFQGKTVVTIPGATKVEHVRQSAGAMKFILSGDEMVLLDELSREFI